MLEPDEIYFRGKQWRATLGFEDIEISREGDVVTALSMHTRRWLGLVMMVFVSIFPTALYVIPAPTVVWIVTSPLLVAGYLIALLMCGSCGYKTSFDLGERMIRHRFLARRTLVLLRTDISFDAVENLDVRASDDEQNSWTPVVKLKSGGTGRAGKDCNMTFLTGSYAQSRRVSSRRSQQQPIYPSRHSRARPEWPASQIAVVGALVNCTPLRAVVET